MSGNRASFIFLITILVWIVISLFVRPGYFDPITPTHSDLFRYVMLSQEVWGTNSWLFPRPLMIAYLKIIGITNNQTVFFLLLTMPAVFFISSMLITAEVLLKKPLTSLAMVSYLAIVFGSPLFLAIAQYDFGGSLSGIFTCLAILIFKVRDEQAPERLWGNLIMPIMIFWISIETKPTFAISMLGAIFALVVLQKFSKKYIYLLVTAISVVAAVFIKDAFLGSKFIQLEGSNDVYTVSIDPIKNISLLAFYIRSGFPDVLLVGLVIASGVLIFNGKKAALLSIAFVALGAAAPMALLVNREWDIYGWYPQTVLALSVSVAILLLQEKVSACTARIQRPMLIGLLLLIISSVLLYTFKKANTTIWTTDNQRYTKNILLSMEAQNLSPAKKYLFVNLSGPYHPFKNTRYIKNANRTLTDFDVLIRESERQWNDMSHEQTNGIYMKSLTISEYDSFIVFDLHGRIEKELDQADIQKLSKLQLEALFFCGTSMKPKLDILSISKAVECFNKEGMYDSSISLFESYQPLTEDFSWAYYHYAQALSFSGKKAAAIENIKKAIMAEPSNPVFIKFLSSLE